eukprot:Gb_11395 [translate_table: standard]
MKSAESKKRAKKNVTGTGDGWSDLHPNLSTANVLHGDKDVSAVAQVSVRKGYGQQKLTIIRAVMSTVQYNKRTVRLRPHQLLTAEHIRSAVAGEMRPHTNRTRDQRSRRGKAMAGTGGRNTISSGILGSAALVQRHDGMPAAHFPASGALDFPRFYHGWMGRLFSLGWVSASGGHIIHSSIHPSILGLLPSARPAVLLCWFCCGVSDYSQNPFLDIFSIAIAFAFLLFQLGLIPWKDLSSLRGVVGLGWVGLGYLYDPALMANTNQGSNREWAMAVQAQYPSNVLLPDFRNRNGQDHRNLLGVGFGSDYQLHTQLVGLSNQPPSLFNAVPNAAHGQQAPSTNGARFHSPEELTCNAPTSRKRRRKPVDLVSLQRQQHSVINLADLHQQAPGTGSGIVSHSVGAVSTGLRLAFEDERINSSTQCAARGDAASPFSFLSEDLTAQLQQQKEEIDQFLRAQGDHLRQSLAEKRQRHSRSVLSVIEEGVLRCMREKDLEMEKMNHRNMELEERVKQLKMEAQIWQSKAKNQEAMVATLRNSLKQAVGQNRGQNREQSKEGCGDSEADDAESAHLDPNVEDYRAKPLRGSKDTKDQRTCKVCRKNDVSILLLPCRHLCLCRDCDIAVDSCPLCINFDCFVFCWNAFGGRTRHSFIPVNVAAEAEAAASSRVVMFSEGGEEDGDELHKILGCCWERELCLSGATTEPVLFLIDCEGGLIINFNTKISVGTGVLAFQSTLKESWGIPLVDILIDITAKFNKLLGMKPCDT